MDLGKNWGACPSQSPPCDAAAVQNQEFDKDNAIQIIYSEF